MDPGEGCLWAWVNPPWTNQFGGSRSKGVAFSCCVPKHAVDVCNVGSLHQTPQVWAHRATIGPCDLKPVDLFVRPCTLDSMTPQSQKGILRSLVLSRFSIARQAHEPISPFPHKDFPSLGPSDLAVSTPSWTHTHTHTHTHIHRTQRRVFREATPQIIQSKQQMSNDFSFTHARPNALCPNTFFNNTVKHAVTPTFPSFILPQNSSD